MQQATPDQKNTVLNLSSDSSFRSCGKESADPSLNPGKARKSADSPGSKTPTHTSKEGKGSSFKSPSLSSIFKVREIPYLDTKGQKGSVPSAEKKLVGRTSPSERPLNQTPKNINPSHNPRGGTKNEGDLAESPNDNTDKGKNRNMDASSASKLKEIIKIKKEEQCDSEKESKSNDDMGSPERTSQKQSAGRLQAPIFLSPSDSIKLNGTGSKSQAKLTCNCQKSKCLKLYCDCFAAGQVCTNCNCIGCANFTDSKERADMIEKLIERNPQVLKNKFEDAGKKSAGAGSSEHKSSGILSFKNNKGCKCKKSGCLKKYCECFQAGVQCSEFCICLECQNNSTNTKISRRGYRAAQSNLAAANAPGSSVKEEHRDASVETSSEERSSDREMEKSPIKNNFLMELEKYLNKEKSVKEEKPEEKERDDLLLQQIKKKDPAGPQEGKIKYLIFKIEEEEELNKNEKEDEEEKGKKLPLGIFRKLFHQEDSESSEILDKKNKRIRLKNVFVLDADSNRNEQDSSPTDSKSKMNESQLSSQNVSQDHEGPQLSGRFFGNRIITKKILRLWEEKGNSEIYVRSHFKEILSGYISTLQEEQGEIFLDYLMHKFEFCLETSFTSIQLSTILEIAIHIFQESFKQRLNLEKSFILFKDLLVRHSLFRPPHSVKVFTLQEIKSLTDFFLDNFYKYYYLYGKAFTPNSDLEIRTFEMFQSRFPSVLALEEVEIIDKTSVPTLREYLIDKETGLTPEELEEIMRGDSIHNVPAKKREEWARQKLERERKEKIDRIMKKETERLNQIMQEQIQLQDEEFMKKYQEIKGKKK